MKILADIVYTYRGKVYLNITNRCTCRCTFCIRCNGDGLGSAETLWHQKDPTAEEVMASVKAFDFSPYDEVTFCGYGEPLCALDNLVLSGKYIKEKYGLKIRVNTNGLGDIYNKKHTVPVLSEFVDTVSISLNAPNAARYNEVSRPVYGEDAFDAILKFAQECKEKIPVVKFSVVDVINNNEIEECQRIADSMGITLRIRKREL